MSTQRQVQAGEFGVPMIVWPIVLVVLILAGAFVWGVVAGEERILVPKSNIPAGERVIASQFKTKHTWRRGVPDGVLKPPAELQGRVTRQGLPAGRPIPEDALAEPVAALETVLGLQPTKASAVGVRVGDRVRLRLAPTGDDPELRSVTVPALLLQPPTDKSTDVVVSVAPGFVEPVLDLAGRATVFVTPD